MSQNFFSFLSQIQQRGYVSATTQSLFFSFSPPFSTTVCVHVAQSFLCLLITHWSLPICILLCSRLLFGLCLTYLLCWPIRTTGPSFSIVVINWMVVFHSIPSWLLLGLHFLKVATYFHYKSLQVVIIRTVSTNLYGSLSFCGCPELTSTRVIQAPHKVP